MSNQYEKLVEQQARLKQKINREDFKLRQSKYYENRQARKARSRRLIQKGALLEKYFQANNLSVEQTEELLKTFADYVNAHKLLLHLFWINNILVYPRKMPQIVLKNLSLLSCINRGKLFAIIIDHDLIRFKGH